jgi:hypothetical protein
MAAFHEAMVGIYRRAKSEAGYTATYFLSMVSERGGYQTAQYLIHTPNPSDGYTALYERGRLDLTVEALVLRPKWSDLFSDEDRELAGQRLTDYGFDWSAGIAWSFALRG